MNKHFAALKGLALLAVPLALAAQEPAAEPNPEGTAPTAEIAAPAADASPTPELVPTIPVADTRVPQEKPKVEEPAAPGEGIQEIIVTAQKRSQRIDEVPIAISAFNGDQLNDLGVTDTRDLSRLVPGFNANESGRGSTLFTLRGVGFTDTTYTATNTVGTYIDEVNLPFSVMTRGANLDIERVEVLKGPQGTLYGRNTTGGLINYIAKAPTDSFEAGTITSFSRFETLESENFISGPLFDSLKGRLAFKIVDSSKGWQKSNTRPGDTLGEQKKLSGRGSLDWEPTDDLTVKFRIEGWTDKSDPTAPQVVGIIPGNPFIGSAGLNPAVANYPYVSRNHANPRVADWPTMGATGDFPGKLDDSFLMESAKAIWKLNDTMAWTTIVSNLKSESHDSPQLQGFNVTETDLLTTAQIKSHALETRLSDLWFDGRFSWSLGVNLSRDKAFEEELADTTNAGALFAVGNLSGQTAVIAAQLPGSLAAFQALLLQLGALGPSPVSNMVNINGKPTIKQAAIFLNTDTELSETFSLNLGVRYTENKQDFTACTFEPVEATGAVGLSNVFTGLSTAAAAQYMATHPGELGRPTVVQKGDCFPLGEDGNNDPFVGKLDEDNVSGRVALSWKPDSDSHYFAAISRGFKAGGFPVLNPARKAQLVPVTQEELLSYELGSKLSFFDRKLHTNLTGFYYDYTDKQLLTKTLDQVFGPLPILQNAPESHVYGVELETQIAPFRGFFVAFAGSYIKTEIDKFVGRNSQGLEQDFAGLPFNFAPEWQLSTTADYTWGLTDRLDVGVGVDAYYTSDTNGAIDQNPLLDMNEYYLLGARLHVGRNDGNWTATLFGRNLTNELVNLGSNSFSEAVTRSVGRPRTFGVTLTYLWQ